MEERVRNQWIKGLRYMVNAHLEKILQSSWLATQEACQETRSWRVSTRGCPEPPFVYILVFALV